MNDVGGISRRVVGTIVTMVARSISARWCVRP